MESKSTCRPTGSSNLLSMVLPILSMMLLLTFSRQCIAFHTARSWKIATLPTDTSQSNIQSHSVGKSVAPFASIIGIAGVRVRRRYSKAKNGNENEDGGSSQSYTPDESLIPPSAEDMKQFALILANVTDCLEKSPETAITVTSQHMGWLFARNVPKLAQMLLNTYPVLNTDQSMMQGYMFLIDFLEAVAKESAVRVEDNQRLMKQLLEAAKSSEEGLDEYITTNRQKLTSADFQLYLDTEIETRDSNSAFEQLLVTIKLRLLEEQGKSLGVDVQLLPKLAVEQNPAELIRKTTMHLDSYDSVGQALFLQTLKIMRSEMQKRYQNVDPLLSENLQEIEKIAESYLKRNSQS